MADLVRTTGRRIARHGGQTRGPVREFLAFGLAGEGYAVELTRIHEILSPPPLTEVPRAPADVIGLCSVRGLLVTVFDLRRRLRLTEQPTSRRTRVLLAHTESGEVVGLLVDEVRQVVRLTEGEIEVASAALGGDVSDYVAGIGRPAGAEVLILLDLSALVAST